MEPALNPALRAAVKVPDAVMDAWRLPMHFFATAQAHGAAIRNFTEVTALRVTGRTVAGVGVMDHRTKTTATIAADLVVNAAGPWPGASAPWPGSACRFSRAPASWWPCRAG